MQSIIVSTIIICSIIYASRLIHKTFKRPHNQCNNCPGCHLQQQKTDCCKIKEQKEEQNNPSIKKNNLKNLWK